MARIQFEKFPKKYPLVAVSDGLFSQDARNFFRKACAEKVPYVGEDNLSWARNKNAIKNAYAEGRKIILIGYSSGCDQVRLEAEWCNENKIPVRIVFFDPTYLAFSSGGSIPENVAEVTTYLSQRNIPDAVAIGKGREVRKEDLRNPKCRFYNRELKGSHLRIFDENRSLLEKFVREEIVLK